MTYEKVRPGGWRDRPYLSTALNPSALDHFEEGIYEASVAAENALPNTPEGRTELAASPELSAAFVQAFAGTTITYDGSGNVTAVTEGGITTTYTYNPDGTVATDTRLGVTRAYTYDGSGNLTSIEEV
ncbi:MAG: hypothetical protein J0H96_05620 [Microbacterium ginsengisoli]|nr:hypothetical protein [Microbacterium ginsengisoli]